MKKILIILTFLSFFINLVSACSYDNWWNSEWKYVKLINISENSGKNLTDYQVLLNIPYYDSMQTDFDDLRFTYCNSSSPQEIEIPYFIEEKVDGSYSKIWIKVPFIPANSNAIIKMYYGNEHALSKSNGNDVFVIFDDFENLDQWQVYQLYGGSEISIVNNYQKTGNTSVKIFGSANGNAYLGRTDIPHDSYIYEIYFFDTKENLPERQIQSFDTDGEIYPGQCKYVDVGYFENYSPTNYTARFSEVCTGTYIVTNISSSYGWHLFGIFWNGTNYLIYIDNQLVATSPDGWIGGTEPPRGSYFGDRWRLEKSTFYWDTYKIRKFTIPEPTYQILDFNRSKYIPEPTNHSIIITNKYPKNIISSIPTRLPIIVLNSSNQITPQIRKFLDKYKPDHIYTLGFSADLENSYEIEYNNIPEIFFPNTKKAIFVKNITKAIIASNLAYYLHLPIIFELDQKYEIINLENLELNEIQNFYINKIKENEENINYLVVTNLNFEESLISGLIAGKRKGLIIPIFESNPDIILEKIIDSVEYLKNKNLFSESLDYKKGESLYLLILGNMEAINSWKIEDTHSEIFNDKDGNYIYSDIFYSDINKDGIFDLAIGRLDSDLQSISLNIFRQELEKTNKTVLIGEYRHPKFIDSLFAFGGVSQAFIIDKMILTKTENKRIVEKRIERAIIIEEIKKIFENMEEEKEYEGFLNYLIKFFYSINRVIDIFYSLLEFDWSRWLENPLEEPEHLEIINENLNKHFEGADIIAYFGLGEDYWLIPEENRTITQLYLSPYSHYKNFTNIEFSGFVYDDHDMSGKSEIKKQIQSNGGEILASSGIVHDPFTTISSIKFFSSINEGKTTGEALLDLWNTNPNYALYITLYPSFYVTKLNMYLGIKDILERVLFGDPASKPTNILMSTKVNKQKVSIKPSGSFTIKSEIKSKYTIENNTLIVFNANSYLIEQERPVIPIFVEEFILSTNAKIENITFKPFYLKTKNLNKQIVYNDSYYTNYTQIFEDCLTDLGLIEINEENENQILSCVKYKIEPNVFYPYPNENFWYVTKKLLDNRTKVYVYIPAVIYENEKNAKVLESGEISIEYEVPIDFNIETENIPLGEKENIKLIIINHGTSLSGKLYMWIEGESERWELTENISIETNSSIEKTFTLKPENKGIFNVKVLFVSDQITIGPRFSFFEVNEINYFANKTFWPEKIKCNKQYRPKIILSQISIENAENIKIDSFEILDSMPKGFTYLFKNNLNFLEFENELLEIKQKLPVYIILVENEKKINKHIHVPKKLKLLDKEYYNITFVESKIYIKTENFEKTNFGKSLEEGDKILVLYSMESEDEICNKELLTETTIRAFSGESFKEKTFQSKILIK